MNSGFNNPLCSFAHWWQQADETVILLKGTAFLMLWQHAHFQFCREYRNLDMALIMLVRATTTFLVKCFNTWLDILSQSDAFFTSALRFSSLTSSEEVRSISWEFCALVFSCHVLRLHPHDRWRRRVVNSVCLLKQSLKLLLITIF